MCPDSFCCTAHFFPGVAASLQVEHPLCMSCTAVYLSTSNRRRFPRCSSHFVFESLPSLPGRMWKERRSENFQHSAESRDPPSHVHPAVPRGPPRAVCRRRIPRRARRPATERRLGSQAGSRVVRATERRPVEVEARDHGRWRSVGGALRRSGRGVFRPRVSYGASGEARHPPGGGRGGRG